MTINKIIKVSSYITIYSLLIGIIIVAMHISEIFLPEKILSTLLLQISISIFICSIFIRYSSKKDYTGKIISMYYSIINLILIISTIALMLKIENVKLMSNFTLIASILIILEIINVKKAFTLHSNLTIEIERFFNDMLEQNQNWYYFVDFKETNYSSWVKSTSTNKHKASTFLVSDVNKEIIVIQCLDSDDFRKVLKMTIMKTFVEILNQAPKTSVKSLSKITANYENHHLNANEIFGLNKNNEI